MLSPRIRQLCHFRVFAQSSLGSTPNPGPRWLQLFRLVQQSFCFGLSKMPPSYGAGGVEQELGDSGDVAVILASTTDQQIIAADYLRFAIGKQGKCEVGFLAQFP